jgi:LytS/YehU family sensor histidine kinase
MPIVSASASRSQHSRAASRFSEELRECRISPMIVQPVVENAVMRGISSNIAGG